MTLDFRMVSTFHPQAPGVTVGEVPTDWAQGRATFGGLVAAIAVRPMLSLVAPERWLRTLNVSFVGPLTASRAECHTAVLREGRALSVIESRIVQDGSVRCVANGMFAGDRPSTIEIVPGAAPEPGDAPVEMPYVEGLMPRFAKNFALRWDNGTLPASGSKDGHIVGACRFRDESRDADVCDVLGLLDSWPPAVVTMLKDRFAAASTASWTVHFDGRAWGGRTDVFWPYEVRSEAATGGCAHTRARMWDPQGRPVAHATQLVAVYE